VGVWFGYFVAILPAETYEGVNMSSPGTDSFVTLPLDRRGQTAGGCVTGQDGASIELEQLHEWQSSPAGMIAGYVVDLVSTSTELKRLSRDPVSFSLIAAEVSDLELVETEISQLISRMQRTKGAAE
jgi:hypothetical protein